MTTEEMSLYAQMVTQITDSIDALTVAVKELREDLHIAIGGAAVVPPAPERRPNDTSRTHYRPLS